MRMISANSLAAFTPEVTRSVAEAMPVRATSPIVGQPGQASTERKLDAVPAQPSTPLPRGSLLDLRV